MKKAIGIVAVTLTALVGAGGAYAQNPPTPAEVKAMFCKRYPASHVCRGQVRAVPEIDARSGTMALGLVLGAGLLGAERLRRRAQAAR